MKLHGASVPKLIAEGGLESKSHYLQGNDPRRWHVDVPHYRGVRYEGIYSGIDLALLTTSGQLEYQFVLRPGTNPDLIRLQFIGADRRWLNDRGDLVLEAGGGEIHFRSPAGYQEVHGSRRDVRVSYAFGDDQFVHLEVGPYERSWPLVIDPAIVYATYLGGGQSDRGGGIAVDAAGGVFVVGSTWSTDFPMAGALQSSISGATCGTIAGPCEDIFVAKLDASGSALIYSTYIGGTEGDDGRGIAVDGTGAVYITGATRSTDFPVVNAVQASLAGSFDAFVAKLNPNGNALVYSTYLGGAGFDAGASIAVNAAGNAHVTGLSRSSDFPIVNALQSIWGGTGSCTSNDPYCNDAFIAKLEPSGSALVYSTYLGGREDDVGRGIAVDSSNQVYVVGATLFNHFPTANALQASSGGGYDAFVTKIDSSGSSLVYSTYLGGSSAEQAFAVAVDGSQNVYVAGHVASSDFPTLNPLRSQLTGNCGTETSPRPCYDAFVTKIDASGASLAYSTYLGGDDEDHALGIRVDAEGQAIVTGTTSSTDFPAFYSSFGGGVCDLVVVSFPCPDAFVSQLKPDGSSLVDSMYLGQTGWEEGLGVAVDGSGNAYITGSTWSTDFPVVNALQPASGGIVDAFVAKVQMGLPVHLPIGPPSWSEWIRQASICFEPPRLPGRLERAE